mmetsp:Transcript_25424/g.73339  ORF Transcript_25424/g.73339 Transcript_25424/m.73339 type:complete len:237 (-) Transcript_25424:229-939(-)
MDSKPGARASPQASAADRHQGRRVPANASSRCQLVQQLHERQVQGPVDGGRESDLRTCCSLFPSREAARQGSDRQDPREEQGQDRRFTALPQHQRRHHGWSDVPDARRDAPGAQQAAQRARDELGSSGTSGRRARAEPYPVLQGRRGLRRRREPGLPARRGAGREGPRGAQDAEVQEAPWAGGGGGCRARGAGWAAIPRSQSQGEVLLPGRGPAGPCARCARSQGRGVQRVEALRH